MTHAWITDTSDGNTIVLKANAKPALTGKVTWQIHNKNWQEDTWEEIGIGDRLTLDMAEVSTGDLVRFLMEDGTVSETYKLKVPEKEVPAAGEPETEKPAEAGVTSEEPSGDITGNEGTASDHKGSR